MKAAEAKNKNAGGMVAHVRQGKVGGWRAQFTEEQSRRLDKAIAGRLRGEDVHLRCDLAHHNGDGLA